MEEFGPSLSQLAISRLSLTNLVWLTRSSHKSLLSKKQWLQVGQRIRVVLVTNLLPNTMPDHTIMTTEIIDLACQSYFLAILTRDISSNPTTTNLLKLLLKVEQFCRVYFSRKLSTRHCQAIFRLIDGDLNRPAGRYLLNQGFQVPAKYIWEAFHSRDYDHLRHYLNSGTVLTLANLRQTITNSWPVFDDLAVENLKLILDHWWRQATPTTQIGRVFVSSIPISRLQQNILLLLDTYQSWLKAVSSSKPDRITAYGEIFQHLAESRLMELAIDPESGSDSINHDEIEQYLTCWASELVHYSAYNELYMLGLSFPIDSAGQVQTGSVDQVIASVLARLQPPSHLAQFLTSRINKQLPGYQVEVSRYILKYGQWYDQD